MGRQTGGAFSPEELKWVEGSALADRDDSRLLSPPLVPMPEIPFYRDLNLTRSEHPRGPPAAGAKLPELLKSGVAPLPGPRIYPAPLDPKRWP